MQIDSLTFQFDSVKISKIAAVEHNFLKAVFWLSSKKSGISGEKSIKSWNQMERVSLKNIKITNDMSTNYMYRFDLMFTVDERYVDVSINITSFKILFIYAKDDI